MTAAAPDGPDRSDVVTLASRSPRRRALLELALPGRVRVVAPPDPAEEPLDAFRSAADIDAAMLRIVAAKRDAVRALLPPGSPVVAADTAVIVGETDGALAVLGQPPAHGWEATVRGWFRDRYAGRTHVAATAVSVAGPRGRAGAVVRTRVSVRADACDHVDRLIAAGEPVGRAGGLAIAGLSGALVVERVEGSLSNVSGLPLRETLGLLASVGVRV